MHFLKMDGITGLFRSVIFVFALVVVSESRVVKVPVSPLVRVEGQAVSIRCDVSEYQGPSDQDFEWSIVLAGEKLLQLVSTFDNTFTDPTAKDRVNSGDINYKKLADNSVELIFKKVRVTDSGLYRCSTPSTDSVISGNYHADVELKVIGDSLKVSSAIPKSAVSEGESVELQCNATRGFMEHTFLSVTWSIRKGSGPLEEILTFGPDDKITVGSSYTQLYTDGGLRLDLRGGGFYGLVLKRAKLSDQGEYVCTAREWVRQGGGRNWRKILEKSEEMGKVVVTPTVIGDSLKVSSAIPKSAVSEGESVELQCNATRGFTELTFLSVTWSIRKGSGPLEEILTVGPDHKIKVGSNYTQLYTDCGLRLDLHGGGFYGLVLKRAKPSDQGDYVCSAREWVRQGEGGRNWRKILEKSEEMGKVVVTKIMIESMFCV